MKLLLVLLLPVMLFAAELKVGDPAPLFSLSTDQNTTFDLKAQTGKWTILYFYPKAGTPGCTAQAIGFNQDLELFNKLGVSIVGISTDSVDQLIKFKNEHQLKFTLLSDELNIANTLYDTKVPLLNYSKRISFIVGPDLTIKYIEKDVDAKADSKNLLDAIKKLKVN